MLQQQSFEWYEYRKNHIGASDAPVILNVSPWKTPYQLWLEKVSPVKMEEKTEAMQRGLALEEPARKCFEAKTKIVMFPTVLESKKHPFMCASLDGINLEGDSILEIKCPNRQDHQMALNGKVPEKYIPQLQHQMFVAEVEKAYYFSFDGNDGKIVMVDRDERYIYDLIQKEREFWAFVENFTPPEMNERDYQERTDAMWAQKVEQWLQNKASLDEFEKRDKELRNDLILLAGNRNTKGAGVSLCKNIRRGNVDYSMIPELQAINLDQYREGKSSLPCLVEHRHYV